MVEASMGHVRDLPQSATDIPPKLKKEEWAKIGVNVDENFEPLYVVPKGKAKIITHLRKQLKLADELILATDEDREGESISWHLIQLLKPKVPTKRMVFHEITKSAIQEALNDTREIDQRLVQAQETRRVLDRLVGYTLSPLIWKKIAYGLSAGRVQSAGMRIIIDRERERKVFVKAEYWDLRAKLEKDGKEFEGRLTSLAGKRIATGKDFDEKTGKPKNPADIVVLKEKEADDLVKKVKNGDWIVTSIDEKTSTSRPSPPFITSTLQQESNRKIGMSARETMRAAQRLYEEGLITYMRTDSPVLSKQAISGARSVVETLYGKEYLSPEPRQYSSKSKSAQEAHEAIRPAGETFVKPEESGLSGRELSLYDLIWKRTVATQMAEAKKRSMSVKIDAGEAQFSANGTRIEFPGFLRAYVEGKDDPDAALEDREVILPKLDKNDKLRPKSVDSMPHETKPPPRYTEASLVQRLEKEGIGRPSTYASILGTIVERGYVRKVGNNLTPTFTGLIVVQLLEKHFDDLFSYSFTSEMEQSLDEIAAGRLENIPYLKKFYLGKTGLRELVAQKEKKIDPDESRTVDLVKIDGVDIRVGRYGPYVVKQGSKQKKDDVHASIPEDIAPADLTAETIEEIIEASERGPVPIGTHPETGENIYCLLGRYGPYLQQGEVTEESPKPRRASIPKGVDYKDISMEQVLKALSLPRDLGKHPETKKPVLAALGRFGPYINHDGDFRSLKKDDDVYTVELPRALEILAQEKKGRGGSKIIADLGKHPKTDKKVAVYEGRYGPYIKYGTKNIKIPEDQEPDKITIEKAAEIIDAQGGKEKKDN